LNVIAPQVDDVMNKSRQAKRYPMRLNVLHAFSR